MISNINIRFSSKEDFNQIINLRYEMLKNIKNDISLEFDDEFKIATENYFLNSKHYTVLGFDRETAVGCATLCLVDLMPTCDHPSGKRAHIMNVYVKPDYRRQKIAEQMIKLLIEKAKSLGITNINLDATKDGRPLYEKIGFNSSNEYMEINLNCE